MTTICLEKSTFWHHASNRSYGMHWFSRILIRRVLRDILMLTKNSEIKFKLPWINVFVFCLSLDNLDHISQNEFENLKWLPICDRINIYVPSTTSKFVNDIGSNYLNQVFQWATERDRTLRNDYRKLKHPIRKTTVGQNSLSFLGPWKWNKWSESRKRLDNINPFKPRLKKLYLAELTN